MSVLRCSCWVVNVGLLEGSDLLNTDTAVLCGHILVLNICILDVIGDHIDAWYCISPAVLIPAVSVFLGESIEAVSVSIKFIG